MATSEKKPIPTHTRGTRIPFMLQFKNNALLGFAVALIKPGAHESYLLTAKFIVQLALRKNLLCARNFGKVLFIGAQNLSKIARTREIFT